MTDKPDKPKYKLNKLKPRALALPPSRGQPLTKLRGIRIVRIGQSKRERQRRDVIARDGPLCRKCWAIGRVVVGNELDHIVPLFIEKNESLSNLQLLCTSCHAIKSAKEAEERGLSKSGHKMGGGQNKLNKIMFNSPDSSH